jgi:diguanylate cyclase (GGDEF)-like protein
MFQRLKVALTRTLYRQWVVGVTLVLAVVLSLFGWEMMRRQQEHETQQQKEQVMALASSLAASSGVWVSARDYSGLQEIVQGVAQFPELRYAMVLDTTGLVLAHQDVQRRGQYLTDLPEQTMARSLQMAGHVTDVVQPIMLGKHHTGWVRVGVANDSIDAEFSKTRRDIVLFTIFSIAIGSLLASLMARYQTRRLRHVERVARALQQERSHLRAEVSGNDEAAQLARHFNAMLDQIEDRERALQQSETLLRQSQHLGKIGGWQWDSEKSSIYWTPETFHIHDMPVETEAVKAHVAIEKSAACYSPEDRELVLRAFGLCAEKGVPYDLECQFVTVKQRHLWIRTQGQAEMRDGKVVKVIGYIADITERKTMEEQIRNLAYFDPLTALPNRRMLSDRLQSAMAGGQRSGDYGALIYLDLDNFKPLNDTHGHAAGDLLLIEVAKRLLHCVRQIDTVARTGGDEFVVILNGLSTEVSTAAVECQQIATKILAALSMPYMLSTAPNEAGASLIEHHCTASLGVTLFKGQDMSMEGIMKKADAAMYQAKEAGRNRIQFAGHVG